MLPAPCTTLIQTSVQFFHNPQKNTAANAGTEAHDGVIHLTTKSSQIGTKMAGSMLWILPVLCFIVSLATTITTYVYPRITPLEGPTPPPALLPYPTDLGKKHPMFGVKMIGVSISSMLEFSVMLVRYVQVSKGFVITVLLCDVLHCYHMLCYTLCCFALRYV